MVKIALKSLFLSVVVLIVGLDTLEVKAQPVKCFDVSSKRGWQYFDLGGPYTYIASVSGGWTVDANKYRPVGPRGHSEPGLERFKQYKYDQGFPFGALFVDIPTDGWGYVWVKGAQQLPKPIIRTAIRINDADSALGDNSGILRVCFSR